MLPGVSPGTVGQGVADGIAGDGFSVVARQQVAPGAVIGIGYGLLGGAQVAGGVGVFLFGLDIARIIVGPDPGLPRCRDYIILPCLSNPENLREVSNATFCFLGNTEINASYTSSRYIIRINPGLHLCALIRL